jgi:hypothetical protein
MDVRWTSPLISMRSEVGNLNSQFFDFQNFSSSNAILAARAQNLLRL